MFGTNNDIPFPYLVLTEEGVGVVRAAVVRPVGVLQVPHEPLASWPHVSHVEAASYVTPGALAKLQRDHKL